MDDSEYFALQKNVISYYESYYKNYDFEANRFQPLILLNEDSKDLV